MDDPYRYVRSLIRAVGARDEIAGAQQDFLKLSMGSVPDTELDDDSLADIAAAGVPSAAEQPKTK